MSEQIREQVSAFLDGELAHSETELLLKRLTRDEELRASFGRYALVGELMRGGGQVGLARDFNDRINRAIDGEPAAAAVLLPGTARRSRLWRPFAGVAVAAGVAAVAVFALQQRAIKPLSPSSAPAVAQLMVADKPKEALSYTVPAAVAEAPTAMPAARLTNYVFAHSKYSSVLGQRNMLSELLTDADDRDAGTATRTPSP
jgi:sigma-E factor negative regulatory protein RseA